MSADNTAQAWVPTAKVNKLWEEFGTFTTSQGPSSRQTGKVVNLEQPPMPILREIVKYEHTTYVEFHRRNNPTRGKGLTTVFFIKNVLSLIQSIEKSAAIICYEDNHQANSICHPSHVLMESDEFKLYFTREFKNLGRI